MASTIPHSPFAETREARAPAASVGGIPGPGPEPECSKRPVGESLQVWNSNQWCRRYQQPQPQDRPCIRAYRISWRRLRGCFCAKQCPMHFLKTLVPTSIHETMRWKRTNERIVQIDEKFQHYSYRQSFDIASTTNIEDIRYDGRELRVCSSAPANNMIVESSRSLSVSILASIGPLLMQVTCSFLWVPVETRQPRAVKYFVYPGEGEQVPARGCDC